MVSKRRSELAPSRVFNGLIFNLWAYGKNKKQVKQRVASVLDPRVRYRLVKTAGVWAAYILRK